MADALQVEIVSPAGSVFRGAVSGIIAPGVEGSFEVLKDHAPMIAAFEVGTLKVKNQKGESFEFVTSGGFVEVLNNRVTVLAESAEPVGAIDVERAKAAEERALERLAESGSTEEKEKAAADLERARNRLRAAMGSV
ncbi:MAG: F0F1 ATP synthase subunit epsilon [Rhodothermales bacterium]|nr:F0F1 ATP synthase subunit epsilon [Rhodothermales bacterium]MBO6779008.1 F0F1 ATP synthase subunit epsilon [Rhodothermales bacterium]